MRKIDRFDKYMIYKGLNDNKVTTDLNLSIGVIGKSRKDGRDLSDKSIEQILKFYTDLNKVWLLTGEGQMLNIDNITTKLSADLKDDNSFLSKTIKELMIKSDYLDTLSKDEGLTKGALLYADLPVSAGQYDVVSTSELPTGYINIPNVRVKWFFPVIGCSMEPEIYAGDTVGVNYVDNREFLDPDKIYMIVTPHERMIKRLRTDNDDKNIIWAISTNYKEIKIYSDDIKAIYHVVYVMKGRLL